MFSWGTPDGRSAHCRERRPHVADSGPTIPANLQEALPCSSSRLRETMFTIRLVVFRNGRKKSHGVKLAPEWRSMSTSVPSTREALAVFAGRGTITRPERTPERIGAVEPDAACDALDGCPALRQLQASLLEPQPFHKTRGCSIERIREHAAKMARTHRHLLGHALDADVVTQMRKQPVHQRAHAPGPLRLRGQRRGKLR